VNVRPKIINNTFQIQIHIFFYFIFFLSPPPKQPALRLGYGPQGTENVKSHPFFKGLDWDAVLKKKIKPPIEIHI